MGKNKLKKFADLEQMPFVWQPSREEIMASSSGTSSAGGEAPAGRGSRSPFGAGPKVLELGCGKGEYTVAMARRDPGRFYIGVDIKGARMWTGARQIQEEKITNAGFLRTDISLIDRLFLPGEVEEIWITFADPQMKKVNKRLTSARFLERYRRISSPRGLVHLKTDSPFLYNFTKRLIEANGLEILADTADLYAPASDPGYINGVGGVKLDMAREVQTYYERQWLDRGKKIKYLVFRLGAAPLENPPEDDLEKDDYRAWPRGESQIQENPRF